MQTVVETPSYLRQIAKIMPEGAREEVVDFVSANPEAGDVIPGTGGIRKMRFAASGRGKRGGARIIYFYYNPSVPLFLLAAYVKGDTEDLGTDAKKALTMLAGTIKDNARRRK